MGVVSREDLWEVATTAVESGDCIQVSVKSDNLILSLSGSSLLTMVPMDVQASFQPSTASRTRDGGLSYINHIRISPLQ